MAADPIQPLRIVVLGYLVRGPVGGLVWHHFQYVLGLAQMGHHVVFLEDSEDEPHCYDPSQDTIGTNANYGLRYVEQLFKSFRALGVGERWAWYDAPSNIWLGPFREEAVEFCRKADVVLNLSGMNPLREWLMDIPRRVFVDTDPAFTQIRHLTEAKAFERAATHNRFFSFGENIGQASCGIPEDGFPWQPTRQPVVLDCWPPTPGNANGAFTTIMQWSSYTDREWNGVRFGMKSVSFQPYVDLPSRTDCRFEMGIGGGSPPREELLKQGWVLHDPLTLIPTPSDYQRFIKTSKAEFSVAKHGYVVSRSGWFSERSAAYLASGRPVITQDTGFSEHLDVGEGLLSFTSPEEAARAIEDVCWEYASHCAAARRIAEREFEAQSILKSLLDRSMD
ncbi:MAG: hypothetical protein ACKOOC_02440 [Cyanobium sp.]